MPTFQITSPDGIKYRVTAPEGATEQDALARVQQQHRPLPAEPGYTTGPFPPPDRGGMVEPAQTPGPKVNMQDVFTRKGELERTLKAAGKDPSKDPAYIDLARQLARGQTQMAQETAQFAGGGPARGIATVAKPLAEAAGEAALRAPGRVLPGASARATGKVADIALPETTSDLGQRMHDTLMQKFKDVRAARSTDTTPLRDAFFGNNASAQPIIDQYQADLKTILRDKGADLSSEERGLLQQSMRELREGKSVEAIDKERRRLNGIAQADRLEGHSAIKKSFAQTLSDKLTTAMETSNSDFKTYIGKYREMSEPINQYMKTGLGRAVTREAVDDIPATDIAQLPARFFKSRQSIDTLKKLAGDDTFVDAAARIRTASELDRLAQGKGAAEAARLSERWLAQNKGWLDAVPEAQKAATDYVANLRGTATTQKVAKVAAGGASAYMLYEHGGNAMYWIRHLMP